MNRLRLLVTSIVLATFLITPTQPLVAAPATAQRAIDVTLQPSLNSAASAGINQPRMAPGVVLVGLKPGLAAATGMIGAQASDASLSTGFASLGVQGVEPVFPQWQAPLSAASNNTGDNLSHVYRLHLPPDADILGAVEALKANPAVAYAEPDYIAHVIATPNDTLYAEQWGLTQINAPAAWDVVTGATSVAIAVIDSGLDTTHPDLAGQLWVNPGEIAGNGVDDDNNGYVDDVNGANIYAHNTDLTDSTGHGTQVAGVIAAATNNGAGIAGVCWQCKLMVVKVTQPGGIANYSDIAAGVLYAAQKGAKVINLSLGGSTDSTTLRSAIAAAAQTAVVVGGAGNDNSSALFYPAAYDDALAVAGTTSTDAKVGTSNYGAWVDVSAPGEVITTTFSGGGYGSSSGTSIAVPFASGLAGLLRGQHPDWSPAQVRAQIVRTADNIDGLNPGYEGQLGSGRLNAGAAVTTAPMPLMQFVNYATDGQTSGALKTGTTVSLTVTLRNDWLDASSVSATLSTSSGSASVTKATASWGAIASGQSATNTADPFQVAVNAGAYGLNIPFTLDVVADGMPSTLTFTATTESVVQTVGGTVTSDTTWTNDRVYRATGNVIVGTGITLTIQPGTVVKFDSGKALLVNGTLIADGTPEQPIRFTSAAANPAPGDWGDPASYGSSIIFASTSQPAQFDGSGNYVGGSIIRYSIIEYSKGLKFQSASPFIDHNTIWKNQGGGILSGDGSQLVISHNRITSNLQLMAGALLSLQGPAVVRQNLIANNTSGLLISGDQTVISNTITDNGPVGTCFSANTAICLSSTISLTRQTGNNIYANQATYDVAMSTGTIGQTENAASNYWGTSDPVAIRARIYDSEDDLNVGTVSIAPFLTQPEPAAPAFLSQLSLNPASPVGIQRVTFDLTFSAPMDQSTNPVASFYSTRRGTTTRFTKSSTSNGLPDDSLHSIAIDNNSNKWFATNSGGAARLNGATWTVYNPANSGLPQYDVRSIAFDSDGSAWFGTGGGGVARLTGTTWTIFNTSNSGLPSNLVYDIAIESPVSRWFATYGGGVAHLNGTQWTIYNTSNSGLPSNSVYSIAIDNQGVKWFGTRFESSESSGGVARFDGTTWTVYNSSNSGLPCNTVSDVAIDYDGAKWFATKDQCSVSTFYGGGVARFDGTTWTVHNTSNSGLPSNQVYAIAIDNNGARWFATDPGTGVARFDGTNWTVYSYDRLGFPLGFAISTIAIDSNGNKWFGTSGNGVSVLWDEQDYPIADNAQWLDSTHWRGTYDINSLVPRDTYSITVSSARGADGLEIPIDTRFGFTVDYAGQITDQTPPNTALVFATGKPGDASYVEVSWSAIEPDSSITGYRYAIGSAAGATDIVNWTTTTSNGLARSGLGLVAGQQYWSAVQAQNVGGLWSAIGYSSFIAGQQTLWRTHLPLVMK